MICSLPLQLADCLEDLLSAALGWNLYMCFKGVILEQTMVSKCASLQQLKSVEFDPLCSFCTDVATP